MKNYKALKNASKVTLEKIDEATYKITQKFYDAETGEALDDKVIIAHTEFIDGTVSNLTKYIEEYTSEKEDWILLKEDLDVLG